MPDDMVTEDEVDIIDMLATQSESDNEEVDEIDLDTDDIEVLKERIGKRNKALKKSKQANHRMQDELADLKGMVEQLRDNPPTAQNADAQRQEQKEVLDQWRESVADKPENSIEYTNLAMGDLKTTVADLLSAQQEAFDAKIAEITGKIDPEVNKYRDKVNSLRQNPDFAGMDDKTLTVIAKNLSEKVPRGSISGKPARAEADDDKRLEDLKARYKSQYNG